jgi:heme oxygenase
MSHLTPNRTGMRATAHPLERRAPARGGSGDGAIWQRFCGCLETYGSQPDRLPPLIAGARHSFAFFRTCLESRR